MSTSNPHRSIVARMVAPIGVIAMVVLLAAGIYHLVTGNADHAAIAFGFLPLVILIVTRHRNHQQRQ